MSHQKRENEDQLNDSRDIYQVLKADHNELKPALDELVTLSEKGLDTKPTLDLIKELLVPHSRAEEAVFYNSLRSIDGTFGTVAHAYEEHMMADTLLKTLLGLEKVDAEPVAVAKKLRESLLHHIKEEEEEIFPKARKVFLDVEAVQMAAIFQEAKEKAADQGDLKNMVDMVANMLPPRVSDLMRGSQTI